jgi:hypothetical protein
VPIVAFVIWIAVMTYYLHTGISRQFDARGENETTVDSTQAHRDSSPNKTQHRETRVAT